MPAINSKSTLLEVAALVSTALQNANITASLSGGAAVSIYTENVYQSKDLDFVTAALVKDLIPVMASLGFEHVGVPRLSQFEHPLIEWYVEFPPAPLSFGNLYVEHSSCAVIDVGIGQLRIITPTHSVLDRLAAAIAWHDEQSRDQAILVATIQNVDWDAIRQWFVDEGESEYERFRNAVDDAKNSMK